MAALLVAQITLATLAFGAVYPWGYLPLFAACALIGIAAIARAGIAPPLRPLAYALALTWAAIALQLVPLPRAFVDVLSPTAAGILRAFSLTFADGAVERLPLSIDPARTQIAALAFGALALFLIGTPAWIDRNTLRRLPRALAFVAVLLALFGIYSRENSNHDTLIYWFWRPQDSVGASPFGPFVNRNHFGGWMLMAIGLVTGSILGQIERAIRERRRHTRVLSWLSSPEANGIGLMLIAAVMAIVALFWTLSRSSITGLAVSAAAFGWLVTRRRTFGTAPRGAILAIFGAALLAGLVWRGPDDVLERFQEGQNLLSRFDAWRDGWRVVQDFPVAGTGLNTYSDAMLFYQTRNRDFHLAQAHNDYLQLLAEGGLLVAVPALAALVLLVRSVRRSLRAASHEARGYWIRAGAAVGMLGVGVQEIAEFSLQIPANALLFCTLAAVAIAPVSVDARHRDRDVPRDTIDPVE